MIVKKIVKKIVNKVPARVPRSLPSDAIAVFRNGFAALNLVDQKRIFNSLDPAVRCALWQSRLAATIAGPLSKEQKKVLQQVARRLTPAVYDERKPAQRKRFAVFWQAHRPLALAAFQPASLFLREISTALGPRNKTAAFAQSTALPPCDCSLAARETDADDCSYRSNCKKIPCIVQAFGCGSWWTAPCDGICKPR